MPEPTAKTKPQARDRGLHRYGEPDPANWDEREAVTGRPNDLGADTPVETGPAKVPNSSFADRAAQRAKTAKKQVNDDAAENKAVASASTKKG